MDPFLTRLQQNCERLAHKTAVTLIRPNGSRESLRYGELETAVCQTAAYLDALGIKTGDCVAIRLPKSLPSLLLNLATMRLGAFVLPLNPAYPTEELRYFLQNAQAALFITDKAFQDEAEVIAKTIYFNELSVHKFLTSLATSPINTAPTDSIDAEQPALMIYTSGTTGHPKGALIPHRNLTANLAGLETAWGWQAEDKLLHVLPIFHYHGLVVALYGALYAGATAVLTTKFDATQTLSLMESERCTVLMAVPSIHRRLVDAPDAANSNLDHVRLITSGSDRLPDDLFVQFQRTFGHTLLERYGMTETGLTLSNPLNGERKIGSVGFPLPGAELRVVDGESGNPLPDGTVGELQMRGPHLFLGYWKQPEATADSYTADGWFKTGDLAMRDKEGYFYLRGRLKDLIITGGLNVYPPEVERVLAMMPGIQASAVIGCEDAQWGERVTAVVIKKKGVNLDEDAVINHCRTHLAPYKAPKRVLFVDELPTNALGKVQKGQLRHQVCQHG